MGYPQLALLGVSEESLKKYTMGTNSRMAKIQDRVDGAWSRLRGIGGAAV